jgi:HSP20 family protein
MNTIPNIIDHLLNRSINEFIGADYTLTVPSANIVEHDNDYQIVLAIPGLQKSDFNIKLEKQHIFISVKKDVVQVPEGVSLKRKEFDYSNFSRNFLLPDVVNTNKVKAEYNDGLLTITLEKKVKTTEEVRNIIIE